MSNQVLLTTEQMASNRGTHVLVRVCFVRVCFVDRLRLGVGFSFRPRRQQRHRFLRCRVIFLFFFSVLAAAAASPFFSPVSCVFLLVCLRELVEQRRPQPVFTIVIVFSYYVCLPSPCSVFFPRSLMTEAAAAAAAAAQDRLGKGPGPRRPPSTSAGGGSGGGGGAGEEDGPVLHVRWAAEDPNPRAGLILHLCCVFWPINLCGKFIFATAVPNRRWKRHGKLHGA